MAEKAKKIKEKKEKKPMDKKTKGALIFGIVLVCIIALLLGGTIALGRSNTAFNNVVVMLMPKTIEYDDNGTKVTFFVEKNEKYNADTDDPMSAYLVYYKDKDSKKVYLENGVYTPGMYDGKVEEKKDDTEEETEEETPAEQVYVTVGFLLKAQAKSKKLVTALKTALGIFGAVVVFYLIYLWYLSWCKREDKRNAIKHMND